VVCTVVEMKVLLDFKTTTSYYYYPALTSRALQVGAKFAAARRRFMMTYSSSIVSLVRAGTCPRNHR
jgi:hypothetical protein